MNRIGTYMALVLLFPLLTHAQESWPKNTDTCVQWSAHKRMFFLKEVNVFGMNCTVDVEVVDTKIVGEHRIKVKVPHNHFESGEPERDRVVSELLGGKAHPYVMFESEALGPLQWAALRDGNLDTVKGSLTLGRQSFPLQLDLSYQGAMIFGRVKTSMSFFNVTVPNVGGGAVAKVRNRLALSFRVHSSTIDPSATQAARRQ